MSDTSAKQAARIEYIDVPISLAVRIGGKVRASNPGCCDSCHEDRNLGFPYDESWLEPRRFEGGYDYESKRKKSGIQRVPWALQFCCCYQVHAFDAALEAARRVDVDG